jgi:hypothetical protein
VLNKGAAFIMAAIIYKYNLKRIAFFEWRNRFSQSGKQWVDIFRFIEERDDYRDEWGHDKGKGKASRKSDIVKSLKVHKVESGMRNTKTVLKAKHGMRMQNTMQIHDTGC